LTWLRLTSLILLVAGFACAFPLSGTESTRDPRLAAAEKTYRQKGPARALPELERLLREFREQHDTYNIALTEGILGALHWRLGNFDDARRHLDVALALKRETGNRLEEGKTLNVLGLLEWDLGHFEQAIERFTEASRIGLESGDARLQGASLNNLSLVYDELGDYDTSLEQYQEALKIYRDADFPRGMSDTLGNIGGVHLLLGHFSEAEKYYRQALEISESLESVPSMSQDHGNLGLAYTGMGQTEKALAQFDRALALAEEAGMRQEQGVWLRGKANAQIKAGRYDLGLDSHRAALDIFAEVEAQVLLLDALHDMGQLQLQLGDPTSAEQYFQRAIDLAKSLGVAQAITANLIAQGDLQYRHRQTAAAFALYRQATQRAGEAGELVLQVTGLLRQTTVHLDQQDFESAGRNVDTALHIARETGARTEEAEALIMQADLARMSGDPATALQSYGLAESIASELGNPDLAWRLQYGRAQSLVGLNRKEAAVEALRAAVGHIESVRNRLQQKRYRAGYLQDKHQVYIELVRLQLELGETGDAFDTAERLRTWSDIQLPAGQPPRSQSKAQRLAEVELRERIRQLQGHLEAEQSRLPPDRRQLAVETFSRELLLAEQQYQSLLDDAETKLSMASASQGTRQSDLKHRLHPGEALIEYIVGPGNIMAFVLTGDGLKALTIPARRQDLRSRLELLRDLLEQRDNDLWKTPAASLSATVLEPLMKNGWLDGANHVYLVPHDILHYLPFALLPIDGPDESQPFIERFTLGYLPTASTLANEHASTNRKKSMLALAPANSHLQHAPEEAIAIARLFGPRAKALLGETATESAFKKEAGQHRILHLATHGYFNKLNPLLSGLQLEPDQVNDGLLEVHEILELNLGTDLVTLSACETGLGSGFFAEIPAGDEFVSLTRAFLQVGSTSVLATLWEVEDRSTLDLMKSFYAHLDTDAHRPDQALASAQRALRASKSFAHPYYWAPFVLVGSSTQDSGGRS